MALLELPADVVRYVLEHVYGETDPLAYEPLSWAETRTHQAAAGLVWAVRFLPTAFTEFAAMVGRQSNADLYQSAGLWVYRWRARRPVVATFTPARNLTTQPTFGRRPVRTALAARLSVSWDLEHGTGNFRQSEVYVSALVNRLEPAQLGRRVTTDQPIELPLPYVVVPATARYLGRTALTRVDQQRWTVELATDWDALPIEKGDTILVDSPLLVASLGTSRGTFLVTGKRYDPATDVILLQAEEAPTAVLTRTLTFAVGAGFGTTRRLTFAIQPVLTRPLTFALSTGLGPGVLTRTLTFVVDVETEPGTVTCFLTFAIGTALPPGTITLTAAPGAYGLTGQAATLSVEGGAALPALDGPATTSQVSALASGSFTHGGGAAPQAVVVTLHIDRTSAPGTAVTYGGVAMTLLIRATGAGTLTELWGLLSPLAGSRTVAWTAGAACNGHISARTFTGVTAFGATQTALGTGTPATLTLASAAGRLVVDAVTYEDSLGALTVGAGQTQQYNVTEGNGDTHSAGSTEAGAPTVMCSWTLGTSYPWSHAAVELTP